MKGSSCRSRGRGPAAAAAAAKGPLQPGRPAGRQASRPCRQGLLSVGPTPTFPHPPPAGYPRRIASFKCRKLSSQVRASDFASSFSLLNGDPPHPAIPCLHLETAPSAPRGGRGLGGGEGGRGTDSPRVRPKESPPFGNPGNPAHACEDHGRAWKQPPSLDIFPSVGGGFPPCLPSEGQKRREGQSVTEVEVCDSCRDKYYQECQKCGEFYCKEEMKDGLCPACSDETERDAA